MGQQYRHRPDTRMEAECFAMLTKGAMSYEVSHLIADGHQFIVIVFENRVTNVECQFELGAPFATSYIPNTISRRTLALKNGEMNKNMLSPTEETLYDGESHPFHMTANFVVRKSEFAWGHPVELF